MIKIEDATGAEQQRTIALARWEGEGGALDHLNKPGDALGELDLRILNRLGAAVLGEWGSLPTEVQRAVLQRASNPAALVDGARLKSEIARFLHLNRDR